MANGIGQFAIGASAIGDSPFVWKDSVYSQYANSPVILQWLDYFSQWVDANDVVDMFYDLLWNVDTAQGYGLDVWGRIVGVNPGRVIPINPTKYLGFEEAGGTANDNYGHAIWYSGQPFGGNTTLTDDAFRQVILAKAAANIWDGSILGLNKILRTLFPGQNCYVTDGLDMTMTYTFTVPLSPIQITLVTISNVLPRPCGVSTTLVQM